MISVKVFIFHCWGGDGRSCWSGYLQDGLRKEGIETLSPEFPETNEPVLSEWLSTARGIVPFFKKGDRWILVGHSLGCPTILRVLETFGPKEKVDTVILVAAFAKDLGIPQISGFVEKEFDWEKIRSCAKHFIVINSDDDPFIPLAEGKRLAGLLGAELIVEHKAGHINEGSGFSEYPRLLGMLKGLKTP